MDSTHKPLTIDMAFAYDMNRNRKVEPEEVLKGFGELGQFDSDDNKKLKGDELEGIYYQIGKDKWAPADELYEDRTDNFICTYELREIDFKKGSIDLRVNCSYLV